MCKIFKREYGVINNVRAKKVGLLFYGPPCIVTDLLLNIFILQTTGRNSKQSPACSASCVLHGASDLDQ